MTEKKCINCDCLLNENNSIKYFCPKRNSNYIRRRCKQCFKERKSIQNKVFASKNKKKLSTYYREWYLKNKGYVLEKSRQYNDLHKDKVKIYRKRNYIKYFEKRMKYQAMRRKTDIFTKIRDSLGGGLRSNLKKTRMNKNNSSLIYMGCDRDQLITHLKSTLPINSDWNDFLDGKLHIDHIIPFKFYKDRDGGINDININEVMNYKNLQLLWAIDNITKNGSYNKDLLLKNI